jgi:tRNA dimethylallyltransferase
VLLVAGPTASGKSPLALAVATAFDGVVINADSMQLYDALPILTAQPDAAARARAPHRLYGTVPAADGCSVGRWRDMALAEVRAAQAAGRLPILVGGTGLYLKAFADGLSPLPAVPAAIRAAARAELAEVGAAAFHARLAADDPVMAARLAPGDSQRLLRAREVLDATGRSLADWQAAAPPQPPDGLCLATLLLLPPREVLYPRCDARFAAMVAAGAVDEARAFAARNLDPGLPIMKAVGLRELLRHVAGASDLDTAIADGQRATRRYAKRQYTWFRHQLTADRVFDEQFSESLQSEIFSFIRRFLLTGAVGTV